MPPKKVIKALYDYNPENRDPQQLPFSKGDFFHVLGREDDSDWYEACNPLNGRRGLVPVPYFEEISKNQRQSGQSVISAGEGKIQHDSGFSENGTTIAHSRSASAITAKAAQHSRGASMASQRPGAMVYGVVQYDFNAERADELEAKAGEAVIVVAQSNPEWFVAKPVARLGGPGLIPVSFVDIKDTATMQSVADPLEAVRRAGVPRVEEWKKFAAEYKNGSISLGKLDAPQSQLQDNMARMSLQNSGGSQQSLQSSNAQVGHHGFAQARYSASTNKSSQSFTRQSQSQPQQEVLLAPTKAFVPRYCFDNDMYWYIIECQMEDGRWWELSRYYADFYDFQIALLEAFPEEAGNKGRPRTLPFMPGPVAHVTDAISNGRRQNLDEYIKKIISMPPHISRSQLVRNLFKPRAQDYEIDPTALNDDFRLSATSQQSSAQDISRTSSNVHNQYGGAPMAMGPPSARHQRGQQSYSGGPPALHTQPSNLTTQSSSSATAPRNAGGAMKVKVFFQEEIVAIRVPQDISFGALKEKLIERLKVNAEDIAVAYRDEVNGGGWVEVQDDEGLDEGINRNGKLTLRVDAISG